MEQFGWSPVEQPNQKYRHGFRVVLVSTTIPQLSGKILVLDWLVKSSNTGQLKTHFFPGGPNGSPSADRMVHATQGGPRLIHPGPDLCMSHPPLPGSEPTVLENSPSVVQSSLFHGVFINYTLWLFVFLCIIPRNHRICKHDADPWKTYSVNVLCKIPCPHIPQTPQTWWLHASSCSHDGKGSSLHERL